MNNWINGPYPTETELKLPERERERREHRIEVSALALHTIVCTISHDHGTFPCAGPSPREVRMATVMIDALYLDERPQWV